MKARPVPNEWQGMGLMNWDSPVEGFRYVLLELVNPERNQARYYCLAWQVTLLGWAVVRVYGRKGGEQQIDKLHRFMKINLCNNIFENGVATSRIGDK